jgi:hypothetical protein
MGGARRLPLLCPTVRRRAKGATEGPAGQRGPLVARRLRGSPRPRYRVKGKGHGARACCGARRRRSRGAPSCPAAEAPGGMAGPAPCGGFTAPAWRGGAVATCGAGPGLATGPPDSAARPPHWAARAATLGGEGRQPGQPLPGADRGLGPAQDLDVAMALAALRLTPSADYAYTWQSFDCHPALPPAGRATPIARPRNPEDRYARRKPGHVNPR